MDGAGARADEGVLHDAAGAAGLPDCDERRQPVGGAEVIGLRRACAATTCELRDPGRGDRAGGPRERPPHPGRHPRGVRGRHRPQHRAPPGHDHRLRPHHRDERRQGRRVRHAREPAPRERDLHRAGKAHRARDGAETARGSNAGRAAARRR